MQRHPNFPVISAFLTIFLLNSNATAHILPVPEGYGTIQTAIDSAQYCDTILISPGSYHERINFLGKNIVVGSLMLTTRDDGYIRRTVIDGDSLGSVVTIPYGSDHQTVLSGLTIQNGGRTNQGGGVNCSTSYPILEYLLIQYCVARNGGGIYADQDSIIVRNSTLYANSTTGSGAGIYARWGYYSNLNFLSNEGTSIYCRNGAVVEDCYFEGNGGRRSGGVIDASGSCRFSRLIIQNNQTNAIRCSRDSSLFKDLVILNNHGSECGGVSFNTATTRIDRALIAGNSASDDRMASAMKFDIDSYPLLTNITIVAGDNPGADLLWFNGRVWPIFINCILDRDSSNYFAFWPSPGSSATFAYCCFTDSVGIQMRESDSLDWLEGNIIADPGFVNRGMGDYRLREDSPCIDAGVSQFNWHGSDILDLLPDSYVGERPDIGWFEYGMPNHVSPFPAIPTVSCLFPSYPNPFNSTTMISFDIDRSSVTRLNIFDLRGVRVANLLDERLLPGVYLRPWNAEGLPSGTYIINLEHSGQSSSQKVSLIR